jgi:hypothetical protein
LRVDGGSSAPVMAVKIIENNDDGIAIEKDRNFVFDT